jgi:DNA-binding transcriptional ArsR family regulator
MEKIKPARIDWDWGSAYDLFFSLHVLHNPVRYGLRGAWAAGVRSRLGIQYRKILEESQNVLRFPLPWIYSLPGVKNGEAVINALDQIPASDRLPKLFFSIKVDEDIRRVLIEVSSRGTWDQRDLNALQSTSKAEFRKGIDLRCALEWWSRTAEFGERYLNALRAYHEVFFAEEELRIQPVLREALVKAQSMADQMELPALLEELTKGVRFASLPEFNRLVLVPSFWSTPFVVYERFGQGQMIIMFGSRPADLSLVPGEAVPDTLVLALKALADPTRLRILRHLDNENLTPTQMARLLRLRAPTVLHHLSALRLAGLVKLTVESDGEKRYTLRPNTVRETFYSLQQFLERSEG